MIMKHYMQLIMDLCELDTAAVFVYVGEINNLNTDMAVSNKHPLLPLVRVKNPCMLANPNSSQCSVTMLCRFPSKLLELHEYCSLGHFKSSNRGVEKSANRWIRM